jgi:hypothetical protein
MQLRLEIDPGSEPITGTLEGGQDQAIEFSGWLGFAAAIEQALRRASRPASGTAPVSQPTGLSSPPEVVPSMERSSSREWMPSLE